MKVATFHVKLRIKDCGRVFAITYEIEYITRMDKRAPAMMFKDLGSKPAKFPASIAAANKGKFSWPFTCAALALVYFS